jgi:hypothetical protein
MVQKMAVPCGNFAGRAKSRKLLETDFPIAAKGVGIAYGFKGRKRTWKYLMLRGEEMPRGFWKG